MMRPLALAALCTLLVPAFAQEKPKSDPGKSLFDGKTLTGWKSAELGGEGEVHVKDGAIVMERGDAMTGATYAGKDFPKLNYEVSFEGKRVKGNDFFCTTTFAVGDTHCSLVVGGWGGQVVGLSSLNSLDASENETTSVQNFQPEKWYKVRIRVTKNRIAAWIDGKNIIDCDTSEKKITIRPECDLSRPFGFCTWRTVGAVREIRVRNLTEAEVRDAGKKQP